MNINKIYGYDEMDTFLTTSCHVYERDDTILTVQLHSKGLHNGFIFAEKNIVHVVVNGCSEDIMSTPSTSHRSDIVHVMYLSDIDIISASRDGGINIWTFTDDNNLHWKNYLSGSRNHLTALTVSSPDHAKGYIVATTKDGYLSIWSRETLLPFFSAAHDNSPCIDSKGLFSVELFEEAGLLIAGGYGRIYVHEDLEESSFSHVTTLGGHKGPVLCLTSIKMYPEESSDRSLELIISGGEDKALRVWDVRMFEEYSCKLCAHDSSITSVSVLDATSNRISKTPLLVSASRDGLIKLWTLPNLVVFHVIAGHLGRVVEVATTVCYNRFNNRPALLSTGIDKRMKVWIIYRVLNWERRKPFALFLAYSGFIRGGAMMNFPKMLSLDDNVEKIVNENCDNDNTENDSPETDKNEENIIKKVLSIESMCREIISFL